MGQGAAKPIRTVLPANGEIDETMEDEEENNIDKLGVSAEENDYPEPRPPDQESVVKEERVQIGNMSEKTENIHLNTVNKGQEGEVFSTKSIREEEYEVELIPVGASFQRSVKKRVELNTEVEDFSEEGKKSYPVVKTLTRSISLRDSLLGSSLVNSSGLLLGTTKREAMLAERERYEYLQLMAPVIETSTHRGQFRRFKFDAQPRDSLTVSTDKFRNVEDRLADEIAEKHRDHRAETYKSLIKDLTSDVHSERLKVKIILAWMSKQSIGRLQFGPKPPPPDTPNGYMMLMQDGQGTFPVFFTLLCRAANLKCAIVSGTSKGSHYEVGSKETEHLRNTWNAVYVEGSWQLVHPLWVCRGVANRQLGGWMKIEEEGKAKRKFSVASSGKDIPSFNPYFIFTKPEEFICRNFPDEERWQLLPNPVTLDEFLEKTYIRPIFFINNFKLKSIDTCIHESETGDPCEIEIAFPKQKASDVVFAYDFSMKIHEQSDKTQLSNGVPDENAEETLDDLADAKRYVMVKKSENSVKYEVRFFKKGTYKLRLYGGYFKEFGNKPPWIMDVLLKCNNVLPQADPLPFDPGSVGWGPGPISENFGLYVPSHVESEVNVTEEEDTIVYFILHHKLKAKAELYHCTIASNELQGFVETNIVPIGDIITLQIRLMHPGKGEYGLKINVTNHQTDVNACNYVVHTSKKLPYESYYPRRARRVLLDAMETCDVDFLQSALDECKRTELPDTDPDVAGARNRFEFLSCKTELYVALLVNRIDVSEHALYRTRKANLDILLAKEMAKVEEHLQRIQKLDEGGWTCEVPEIDRQSLVELSQLRKPKIEVRLVITAMYMLLGIEEENLKDWGKVRKFLRNQQSTLIEMARLEKYLMLDTTSDVTVSGSVLDRVQEILTNYTEENIRRVDNTAAAYFQWVTSVTEKLEENQKKMEASRLAKKSASKSTTSFRKILSEQTTVQSQNERSRQKSLSIKSIPLKSIKETTQNKSQKDDGSLDGSTLTVSTAIVSKRLSTITQQSEIRSRVTSDRNADSQKSPEKKNSALTLTSNKEGSRNIISTTTSSKKIDVSSKEESTFKDRSSMSFAHESDGGKRAISQKSSRGKSLVSPPSTEGVHTQKSAVSQQSSRSKMSQESIRSEHLSKKSSKLGQKSLQGEKRDAINTTPMSGTDTIRKSIKSLKNGVKTNGSVSVTPNVGSKNIAKKGTLPAVSPKANDISGRTFFSESGGSQKGATSRPVSKKSKVSSKETKV